MQHKKNVTGGQPVTGKAGISNQFNSQDNPMIPQFSSDAPTNFDVSEHIEILDMHPVDHRSIRGECRVRLGGVIVNGVRVIVPALASHPFVAMPSRPTGDGNGWIPIVTVLSPTLLAEISERVLAAWYAVRR